MTKFLNVQLVILGFWLEIRNKLITLKMPSSGVFIDLKKAFDTVNHEILLDKLNFYGFRGLINDWFQSYLKNRTQTIQIGEHLSTKLISSCGVPQGSVLKEASNRNWKMKL